jgi:hypothetical protein
MNGAFGHWLAGFIDGEGCFQIVRQSGPGTVGFFCQFDISVRADDVAILREAQARTGLGTVKSLTPRGVKAWNPSARWICKSKADAVGLCELLDTYPLRAKKAADYAVWREAVVVWQEIHRGGTFPLMHERNAPFWRRMANLKLALDALRLYDQEALARDEELVRLLET